MWYGGLGSSSSPCHKQLKDFILLPSCQGKGSERPALAGLPDTVCVWGAWFLGPGCSLFQMPGVQNGAVSGALWLRGCSLFPFFVKYGQSRKYPWHWLYHVFVCYKGRVEGQYHSIFAC